MANPRAEYVPLFDRPKLTLPNNARIAVWVVINVEDWDINEPMARAILPAPQGRAIVPDIPNFGWHEYGMRAGFWRIKQVLDRHGIPATISLNAAVCQSYPPIARACVDAGWELMGHGYIQRPLPVEADERAVIRRSIAAIKEFSGQAPRGWMGPGLAESHNTPDLLAAEGIEYVCDWCADDLPFELKVKHGRLVSIPYTLELNDIPIFAVQHHRSPEMFERACDSFDTLYAESKENARVMAISTHPYITGAPHRIKYFNKIFDYIKQHEGVWFCTGSQILDWYNGAAR